MLLDSGRTRALRLRTVGRILFALLTVAALAAPSTAQQEGPISVTLGRSLTLTTPWPVKGVSITDAEVVGVEVLTPTLVLLSGKSIGATDLTVWDESGSTWVRNVAVELDVSGLETKLQSLFPQCRLSVTQSQNVLVVTGTVHHADVALHLRSFLESLQIDYVDMTSVPGVQQVQVKVRLAEVSRTGIRALGVNALKAGEDAFGALLTGSSSGGPINPVSIGPPDGASATPPIPFNFNSDVNVSPAVTLFGGFPSQSLEVFLSALAEDQFLRILAEPTLIALSGQEASFLAGGEFPIPVVQGGTAGGSTSITIEYKEFGVRLNFRPVVLGEGTIELEIGSEVSELTEIGAVQIEGFQVPSLVTRRTDTTLQMRSGQTFAMAGLIREKHNAKVSEIPILGSLPIIGVLFRSVRYQQDETELVVMVTVDLVEPLERTSLPPLPGTMHIVPDDWELYVSGRLEGRAPAGPGPESTAWLKELGLDELRGPGAWSTHGQRAPLPEAYR